MAKIPKLPKGQKAWEKEDRTPAALRENGTSVEGRTIPPEVFLSGDRVSYWQRQASWTMEEAALLWCGLDPLMLRGWAALTGRQLSDVSPVEWVPRVHALRAAAAVGDLRSPARPREILQWLADSGAHLSPFLQTMASAFEGGGNSARQDGGQGMPPAQWSLERRSLVSTDGRDEGAAAELPGPLLESDATSHLPSEGREGGAPAAEAAALPTVHRVVGKRANALSHLIADAISECGGDARVDRVWAQLDAWAAAKRHPLIGAAEGELKYTVGGETKMISRKNLADRLRRLK